VLALAATALILRHWTLRRELLVADVAIPLALLYLVTLLYTSVTFACTARTGQPFCHVNGITGDNILPQIFADNVYKGHARSLIWGWQGSDRPALQTGATLMQGVPDPRPRLVNDELPGHRHTLAGPVGAGHVAAAALAEAAWAAAGRRAPAHRGHRVLPVQQRLRLAQAACRQPGGYRLLRTVLHPAERRPVGDRRARRGRRQDRAAVLSSPSCRWRSRCWCSRPD